MNNPSHLWETLKGFHNLYCRLTDRVIVFDFAEMSKWEAWSIKAWTENDLNLVIRFIQVRIKQQRRREESLRLHLLLDPERFRDDLHDARVMFQKPRPATVVRDTVVNGTHRALPQPRPVRTAADVLAGMKAAEEFSRLKQIL